MATTITGRIPFPNPKQACLPIFGQRGCCEINEDTNFSQANMPHKTSVPLHPGASRAGTDTTTRD